MEGEILTDFSLFIFEIVKKFTIYFRCKINVLGLKAERGEADGKQRSIINARYQHDFSRS